MPVDALPFLTAHLAGCEGDLKTEPEDFIVEELPLYAPAGAGEHIYVLIEKRGLTTQAALNRISQATGCRKRSMGYAGLKDARAVTRQWISIHTPVELPLQHAESDALRVLRVTRHANKLRVGHLAGNRFEVTIRNVNPAADTAALLALLTAQGFPNYYGEQRFGMDGDNAAVGRRWLLGAMSAGAASAAAAYVPPHMAAADGGTTDPPPLAVDFDNLATDESSRVAGGLPGPSMVGTGREAAAVHAGDRPARRPPRGGDLARLQVNAYQAQLFNELVALRLHHFGAVQSAAAPGPWDALVRLLPGDVAIKHDSGGCFIVAAGELGPAQARAYAHEISASAPLFGYKSLLAEELPGRWERALLAREGLRLQDFRGADARLAVKGMRRAVRAFVRGLEWRAASVAGAPALRLRFELERGVYATSFLRELTKAEPTPRAVTARAPGRPSDEGGRAIARPAP